MMMQMIHRKLERIRKETKKVLDVLVGMVYTQRNLLNDKREIQLSQYSRRSIIKNVKDLKIVSYSRCLTEFSYNLYFECNRIEARQESRIENEENNTKILV